MLCVNVGEVASISLRGNKKLLKIHRIQQKLRRLVLSKTGPNIPKTKKQHPSHKILHKLPKILKARPTVPRTN